VEIKKKTSKPDLEITS